MLLLTCTLPLILAVRMHIVVGDGDSCDILQNCDVNARCVFDDHVQAYTCRCNPGFAGKFSFFVAHNS